MEIIEFVENLNSRKLAPEKIEIAQWYSWTLVSSYSEKSTKYISESVAMGIDKDPHIALAKSLSEFLERKISKQSEENAVRLTERSDGFAAFPVYSGKINAQSKAQQNALGEATERFAWASWWDDSSVAYTTKNLNTAISEQLRKDFHLKSLTEIIVPTTIDLSLKILLAETANGGFVTGGAAGTQDEDKETFSRAFGELLRHLLVVKRMTNSDRSNLSFYEQRLWGFASGDWSDLVIRRLRQNSNKILELPPLVVNQPISHLHQDLVSIHRCLFENQPIFIGGPVERLCI